MSRTTSRFGSILLIYLLLAMVLPALSFAQSKDDDADDESEILLVASLPRVKLTSPAADLNLPAPANIVLTAIAAAGLATPSALINRVEFYNGQTLLGTTFSAPFSFSWNVIPSGSYTITARAYDSNGRVAVSPPSTLTVGAPAVSLTAPANNAVFIAPASINIAASASDSDGSIAKVEFFNGATKLLELTSPPYSFNWQNVPAGSYTLTARATDNSSLVTTSSPVSVTVNPPNNVLPTVALTSPTNNASFSGPANIVLSATASDSDGTVAKVEFFNGAIKLGEAPAAPFTFGWLNVPAGSYSLTARATDNSGGISTSAAVTVVVTSSATVPALVLSQPSINFGAQQYGLTTAPSPVTLSNIGNAPLTISSIQPSFFDFAIAANNCPSSLAAGASCTVQVNFTPSAATSRSGALMILSNASGSPHQVMLVGTGLSAVYNGAPLDDKNLGGAGGDSVAGSAVRQKSDWADGGAPVAWRDGPAPAPGWDLSDPLIQISDPLEVTGHPDPQPITQIMDVIPVTGYPGLQIIPGGGSASPGGGNGGEPRDPECLSFSGDKEGHEIGFSNSRMILASLDIGRDVVGSHPLYALDPVHTATGNKFHDQVDYSPPDGSALFSLRTYNSSPSIAAAYSRQNFGVGWSGLWDRAVIASADGSSARITRGDGKSYLFTKQANGTFASTPDVVSILQRLTDSGGNLAGWTYTALSDNVENYDSAGRLTSLNRRGQTYSLSYDSANRLASVQSPLGRQLQFTYDSSGRVSAMIDPAGGQTLYAYDAKWRLTGVTYPDGRTRGYLYEDPEFAFSLTGIIDGTGVRYASFQYDYQARTETSQFAGNVGGGTIAYGGTTSATTDAVGTVLNRTFNTIQGQVVATSLQAACLDCTGQGNTFVYDDSGLLISQTGNNGLTTNYSYDARKLLSGITEAAGTPAQQISSVTWHPTFRQPTQVQTPAYTANYQYDTAGRLTQKSISSGGQTRTTQYTYNAQGLLTQVKGPRTDVVDITTYGYDAQGRQITVTNALGQTSQITSMDANGRPLSISYPNGTTATFSYDARGRLLSKTDAGRTTAYTYDLNGNAVSETTPEGVVTTNLYDPAQRLIGKDSSRGEKIRYTLDAAGRTIKIDTFDNTNLLVSTASTVYDGMGRVKQSVNAAGQATTYQYDAKGNVTQVADALGNATQTTYDATNRPILVKDPLNGQVQTQYNANGQVTQINDPNNNATNYSYNGFGEQNQIASPDTGTTTVTFNEAGSPAVSTDARGKTASYTYDALGRVTQVAYVDGSITKTYDVGPNGVGRLATVTDPSGSTAYTYDSYGRTASKTVTIGGISKTIIFTRNAIGQVTQVSYPSGQILGMAYSQGRVTALTLNGQPLVSGIQYFPLGGAESWLYAMAGGITKEYTRYTDQNGRTTGYLVPNGQRTLAYDAGGHITSISDPSLGTQTFGYDANGRLMSFSGFTSAGSQSQSFTYDANGNRLSSLLNGVQSSYAYQPLTNKLATVTGGLVRNDTYDGSGNLTSDGVNAYTYDARGRMTQALAGGLATTYSYNSEGLRVKKQNASETKLFVYDDWGRMLGEYDQSGNAVRELVWLGSTPVAVMGTMPGACVSCMNSNVGYLFTDHLNTPREIIKQNGESVWKWESLPFGETVPDENPSNLGATSFNHRFPGQYKDSETGLHQNWNRDYDPLTGRYVKSDPIGLVAGPSTYSYVNGNPVSFVDPLGLAACSCPGRGNAPSPGTYQTLGASAGSEALSAPFPFGLGISLGMTAQFARGGSLDAQVQYGGSPAYANYVFGVYMSAAGFSLSQILSAANAYGAALSNYPASVMSPDYPNIPASNVANITRGVNDQSNGTLCQ